jgi:hypothetical protein
VVPLKHGLTTTLPSNHDAMREVAANLPVGWLNAYDNAGPGPDAGVSPLGALDRLDQITGVVRFKHLELLPGLRRPIADIVSTGAAMFTPSEKIIRHSGVSYVSSGGSNAAMHVDLHPNLFIHLAGEKQFSIAGLSRAPSQYQLILDKAAGRMEAFPEFDRMVTFELRPGDALYVPPFTFHRVETAQGRTISVACSWSTPSSERAVRLHRVNVQLRRLGVKPTSLHQPRWSDKAKLAAERLHRLVH